MNETETLPVGPYKAYDVLTNEYLGGYSAAYLAHDAHPNRAITTIYRPGRRKKVSR